MSSLPRGLASCLAVPGFLTVLAAEPAMAQERGTSPIIETRQPATADAAPLIEPAEQEERPPLWVYEGDSLEAALAVSAVLSQTFLGWSDSEQNDVYVVSNAQDGVSVEIEGKLVFGEGWTLAAVAGADFILASSDEVDQMTRWGLDNRAELSSLYASLGREGLGTVVAGFADTASDGIDDIDLGETDAIADAGVDSWNANFLIRPAGEPLSELRWGDFIDGTLAGDTRRMIGYVTPDVAGFEASAAVGERYWDVALRYTGEWADALEVEGGIGYWRDTLRDGSDPMNDAGWGGSLAVKHTATGINLAVNYATATHSDNCSEPGALSGLCRGDDSFYYVKGGIVRDDLAEWGQTAFYGEFYRGRKGFNESDPDILSTLERTPGEAGELKNGHATVWGVGLVQAIDAWNTDLYLGYRHYGLDVNLFGKSGPVAGKRIDGFDAIMLGARISY